MCESDEPYVRSCLDGHPEAFRQLVVRHQDSLARYLTGRLGKEEEAVEAAQETMVRACFALRKLRNPGAFRPWLFGIADRVAKEALRARRRRCQIVPSAHEPEEVASDQRIPDIRRAIGELPEAYKKVILLRFYGGLTCAEISRDLDVPIGTVTKHLSRAYAVLRETLPRPQQTED